MNEQRLVLSGSSSPCDDVAKANIILITVTVFFIYYYYIIVVVVSI